MRVAVMGTRVSAHNVAVQPVRPVAPREVLKIQTVATGGVSAQVDGDGRGPNLVEDLVAARTYAIAFQANARVIQCNDEMLGTLFDAFA